MTAKITGGVIAYEFGKKADEEYAPAKKARVELRFDIEEGSDPAKAAAHVMALCVEQVHAVCGLDAPAKRTRATKTAETPAEVKPASDKDKLAAAAGLPTGNDLAGMTEIGKTQEKNVQAAAEGSKKVAEVMRAHEAAIKGNTTDPASMPETPPADDFLGEAKQPVSDQDMNTAAIKKNGEINDAVRIRKLTSDFGGNGMSVASVPQDKRHDFLAALDKLKKAA